MAPRTLHRLTVGTLTGTASGFRGVYLGLARLAAKELLSAAKVGTADGTHAMYMGRVAVTLHEPLAVD